MKNRNIVRFSLIVATVAIVVLPSIARVLRAREDTAPGAPARVSPPASGAASAGSRPAIPASRPVTLPAALDPNHVIITVGDQTITVGDFDAFVADLPARDQAVARGPGRRELGEYMIKMKLLAAEAARRKLQDEPHVKRQLRAVHDQILANALVGDVQERVDEASLRKFYEQNKANLDRVAARHVLIRTPGSQVPLKPGQKELTEEQAKAKAVDIVKRLKAGEDFAKIAREESDDSGSGAEGGDLGSFTRTRMVVPFSQAAFALKEGGISEPVKSKFGWHVIQVTQKFDTFEKLEPSIRQQFGPQKTNDLVAELRKQSNPQLDESFFGPPPVDDRPLPPGATAR